MKKIDLEAHFYTGEYLQYLRARKEVPMEAPHRDSMRLWYTTEVWEPHGPEMDGRLCDLAGDRLKDMDEAGIDMQVLSLSTPGCEQFSPTDGAALSRKANDELAKAIKRHPDRFIGLAALAPQSPGEAADELERAVVELGFRGAKVHSHIGDAYLDDERYQVILERAEKLGVPIYLHPTVPHPSRLKAYSDDYSFALAGPVLGFGAETALQAMRLIYSGVFDEYPDLKIILGHLGEGLIFWLDRIDFVFKKLWMDREICPQINKRPSEYIRNNFIITTSGMFAVPAFLSVFLEMGADRMMFAADYPYENNEDAVSFMEKVPIADTDREKIYHLNAEKLFKLS
jgi:predicted TIM-barrel fold metal-dependent hydrolase